MGSDLTSFIGLYGGHRTEGNPTANASEKLHGADGGGKLLNIPSLAYSMIGTPAKSRPRGRSRGSTGAPMVD